MIIDIYPSVFSCMENTVHGYIFILIHSRQAETKVRWQSYF